MKRALVGALAAVMLLPAGVMATGSSGSSLKACVDESRDWAETDPRPEHWGFRGGVKVYAKDRWKGINRVLCGATALRYTYEAPPGDLKVYFPAPDPRQGETRDFKLNKRASLPTTWPGRVAVRHPYLDIWNKMTRAPAGKGIESFRAIAAPGCKMRVTLWGNFDRDAIRSWTLDNRSGTSNLWKKVEVPRRFWGVKDIVWKWRKVWDGTGYVMKKVRVEVYGWVPFDDNITGVSLDIKCPTDFGDPDDYVWEPGPDLVLK